MLTLGKTQSWMISMSPTGPSSYTASNPKLIDVISLLPAVCTQENVYLENFNNNIFNGLENYVIMQILPYLYSI